MPRKPQTAVGAGSGKQGTTAAAATSPAAPVKINVYDQNAVKQLLDDAIINYVLDKRGLDEDMSLSNYKLVLGAASCAIALASHFAPMGTFPENMWFLKACVVAYFVISFVLSYVSYSIEGHTILTTKDTLLDAGKISRFVRAMSIDTVLPKCEEQFDIRVRTRRGKPIERSLSSSIGRWFQEDGTFLADLFEQDLDNLFRGVEDDAD